ncbi:MAG: toll/interleukin-1 receptor domain-containing protein [Methanoregula sp.]|jgi:hypothetical protein|nr:toll/interleukin-1 receptor domain-containing protein [Methanoregula sp.]
MNNLFTDQQQSSVNEPQKGNFLIFSSYCAKDSDKIKPILENILQIKGVRIFFAERDLEPGDLISEKIKQNIVACHVFLVFYSESAHQSTYVQHEVGFAIGHNKIIIPILLDNTKPTGLLSNVHYLDFTDDRKRLAEFSRLYNFIEKSKQTKDRNTLLGLLALAGIGIIALTAGQNQDEDDEDY